MHPDISQHFIYMLKSLIGMSSRCKFGTNQYNTIKVNGFSALKAKKVRLVAAKAGEINLTELFDG